MLERLRLHNFKAFEDLSINFAPLTLLLGPNNSGKSSILAPLRLLAQTLDSPDPEVPLLLSGLFGDFGTFRDVVYRNHRGRPFSIAIELSPFYQGTLGLKDTKLIGIEVEYKFRTQRREVILRSCRIYLDRKLALETEYSADTERQAVASVAGSPVPPSIKASLSRMLRLDHFLPAVLRLRRSSDEPESALDAYLTPSRQEALIRASRAVWEIRRQLQDLDYLGPMRSPPLRTYQYSGERRSRVGLHGEYAPGIIAMDASRRGRKRQSIASQIGTWLASSGIAERLEVNVISDRHYELRLRHPVTRESENLADVGFGSGQVIPVLAAGYSLGRGSVLLIEEPEIHLHPRAQAFLGDFLVDLHERGVQTIVETHSEHLVLRIQQHIAADNIYSSDIAVNYVYADEATGRKVVAALGLNDRGAFTDEWPEGFFPERLEEAKRLARIRQGQVSLPFR